MPDALLSEDSDDCSVDFRMNVRQKHSGVFANSVEPAYFQPSANFFLNWLFSRVNSLGVFLGFLVISY